MQNFCLILDAVCSCIIIGKRKTCFLHVMWCAGGRIGEFYFIIFSSFLYVCVRVSVIWNCFEFIRMLCSRNRHMLAKYSAAKIVLGEGSLLIQNQKVSNPNEATRESVCVCATRYTFMMQWTLQSDISQDRLWTRDLAVNAFNRLYCWA